MVNLLIISFLLFLSACSFSKDSPTDESQQLQEKKVGDKLTELQTRILGAVSRADIASINALVMETSPEEMEFRDQSVTPLSIAAQSSNENVVTLLISLGFDPFHLGELAAHTNDRFIKYSLNLTLERLKNSLSSSYSIELNNNEKTIYKAQKEKIDSWRTVVHTPKFSKSACPSIEGRILLSVVSDKDVTLEDSTKLIKKAGCENTLSAESIFQIFIVEMIRQFPTQYKNTEMLKHVASHKNFEHRLWNIDNSDIWVAPALLYRISLSILPEVHQPETVLTSHFLEQIGLGPLRYELIDQQIPDNPYSFLYFMEANFHDTDPFYDNVSAYMTGRPVFHSWHLGWQKEKIMEE